LALKFDDVLLEIADGPAELEEIDKAALTEILDVGLGTSPPLGYLRLRPILSDSHLKLDLLNYRQMPISA
jgi:hypothetical protein